MRSKVAGRDVVVGEIEEWLLLLLLLLLEEGDEEEEQLEIYSLRGDDRLREEETL